MNLTVRGWGVIGILAFSIVMASLYGPRSLNAVVAPLVIVLVAAAVSLSRTDRPTLDHAPVTEGYPGESRTVTLDIDINRPIAATVEDDLATGLRRIDDGGGRTTLRPESTESYAILLDRRGDHTIGPTTVRTTDLLGLIERSYAFESTTSVLVFPEVYDLNGASRSDLEMLASAVRERDRREFDHLREYDYGDPLRDIHWKSTAKRPTEELIVKEFVADDRIGSVRLLAECEATHVDEMAAAAASVISFLFDLDVAIGLDVPDGTLRPDTGYEHYREILRLLARTDGGMAESGDHSSVDIHVHANDSGTTISVGSRSIPFERLVGRRVPGRDSLERSRVEVSV